MKYENKHIMECNGVFCTLNMPKALKSENSNDILGEELSQKLPPYNPIRPYLVDEFPACPKNWMRSDDKITSYFVPVEDRCGLWLDFNKNTENEYEVAIVISIQGVNPITGMPSGDHLEQYIDKCPKHDIRFGKDRFCSKCGYKWPKQNYISTNATPKDFFWLDGFRAVDGIVRQYILTQEKIKSVANSIIGEDRVYSIGLNFFLSKNKKPKNTYQDVSDIFKKWEPIPDNPWGTPWENPWEKDGTPIHPYKKNWDIIWTSTGTGDNTTHNYTDKVYNNLGDPSTLFRNKSMFGSNNYQKDSRSTCQVVSREGGCISFNCENNCSTFEVTPVKLEVGAGAKIRQTIYDDPQDLSFWNDEAIGMICINYAMEEDIKKILKQERIKSYTDGFMANIQVGN